MQLRQSVAAAHSLARHAQLPPQLAGMSHVVMRVHVRVAPHQPQPLTGVHVSQLE